MTDVSMLALNYLVDKNSTISEKGRNLRGRKTDSKIDRYANK